MSYRYDFENLEVYKLAVRAARWMRTVGWPRETAHLKDQATGAAESMVLNIAEGCARGGKTGRNHYRIARGSAGEALAVLDLVDLEGAVETQQHLRRVGAMLVRMSQ